MLEVAIRSFEALLDRERELGSSLADPGTPP
jgi:hypothetical protein